MALVEEILLQPRWDEEQFDLIKSRMINSVKRNMASPDFLASIHFNKLVYGENNIHSLPTSGTVETLESITMDDLKEFYNSTFSPSVAKMHIVGKIGKNRVLTGLQGLSNNWPEKEVVFPNIEMPEPAEKSAIYFVDVPGAKQSVINIGHAAVCRTSDNYYPAVVMNYKLGGSFNGIVNLILREEKGFTYGARSGFSAGKTWGDFVASSSVRSSATQESVQIFKDEIEKYREGISDDDLEFTKNALVKSNARRFETIGALLNMLTTISSYDLPFDYVKNEEETILNMTKESHKKIAQELIQPDNMVYVVVGDAATQLSALENVGFGKPILVNN
jgi:zinc protease